MIDIENAKLTFKEYVKKYDPSNSRIALKIAHTYRVAEIAKQVAKEICKNQEDIELAELIGILHDIGRFEQLKRFDSFIDRETVDHAKLGIEILTDNNNELLNKFCPETKYHNTIITSIENHNKYKIQTGLNDNLLMHCKIIRDSDKIDILNLCRNETFQTLYKKDDISKEKISSSVYNDFINNVQTNRNEIQSSMDEWILNVGLIFDINYSTSFRILKEKNYIEDLLNRVENEDNKNKIEKIKEEANTYINKNI